MNRLRVLASHGARGLLALIVVLTTACGRLEEERCPTKALSVDVAADAGTVVAGTEVAVTWEYRAGGWAFNTMELMANDALICSVPLARTAEAGGCT